MRKLNNILSTIGVPVATVLLLGGMVVFSGCREEVGCTNRRSDKYNPDAVRDDGSCINARDKFLGIYKALLINWPDSLPDAANPALRYFTVAEDQLRESEDDIKILNFGMDSVVIRGLVDRHAIDIPMQSLSVRGIPMTFTGEGHIDDDGYLTILYNMKLMQTGQFVCEDCLIFGQRLDN